MRRTLGSSREIVCLMIKETERGCIAARQGCPCMTYGNDCHGIWQKTDYLIIDTHIMRLYFPVHEIGEREQVGVSSKIQGQQKLIRSGAVSTFECPRAFVRYSSEGRSRSVYHISNELQVPSRADPTRQFDSPVRGSQTGRSHASSHRSKGAKRSGIVRQGGEISRKDRIPRRPSWRRRGRYMA
ncbi:hypothetical protein BC826DRAFT_52952 [Russula brevipes]|nr:hypothetical protein BC826DRAFT_52952 [Russula brevipes]